MTQILKPVRKIADTAFGAFGPGSFGERAEKFARLFGTPRFLIGQSVFVVLWIGANVIAVSQQWDPYPFILLNLMFSLQAAYAAPLILLAQSRQAERDKLLSETDAMHREEIARVTAQHQEELMTLVRQVHDLVSDNKSSNSD